MTWVSGVNTGSYPRALEGGATTATAYFTEVLAVKKPYDPAISEDAVKVYDSIWRANNYALSKTTDEAAPTGFTMVEEYDWLHNTTMVDDKTGTGNTIPYGSNTNDMPLTCLDEADMSNLTEFWFAMKLEGGAGFYVRNSAKYTDGDWLYYHGVRAEDNTWTLYLNSPDGFKATQTGIAKELLKDIISYHAKSETEPWDGGAYPTKAADSETAIVYFTEVIGVKKPFKANIAENATKILNAPLKESAITASETAAPEGFSTVSKYANAVEAGSYVHSGTYGDKTDLSAYSDIYFALRVTNGKLDIGGTNYTGNAWVYVH